MINYSTDYVSKTANKTSLPIKLNGIIIIIIIIMLPI